MKLNVTSLADSPEDHTAEVIEQILRLVTDVASVGWKLAMGEMAVFDGIGNVHTRRNNHVA